MLVGTGRGAGGARVALASVTDAISALYVEIKPNGANVSPLLGTIGFVMGVVTSVIGAALGCRRQSWCWRAGPTVQSRRGTPPSWPAWAR